MKTSGIYKIESKLKPEKIYIGSAINIGDRWRLHLSKLRLNKHPNKKLQYHYNKYGEVNFNFSVLLGCEKEDLIKTEQYFIDSYNPWFNICKIAGSSLGVKRSDETRNKMRGNKNGANTKGHLSWNKGKTGIFSEEVQRKRSKSLKGKNTWIKGTHPSKEAREKRSKSMKLAWGKKKWNIGRKASDEMREKMSKSMKLVWANRKLVS